MKRQHSISVLLILSITALTGVGVYLIQAVEHKETRQPVPLPVAVEVAPVRAGTFLHRLEALGTIYPRREGEVSAKVRGQVAWISEGAELGSVVQPQQRLARVDPDDFRLEVTRREALLSRARATLQRAQVELAKREKLAALKEEQLRLARSEFERLRKLLQQDLVSRQEAERQELAWRRMEEEFQSAKSALGEAAAQKAIAEAESASAMAELEQAQKELRDTEIKAPFSGVIAEKKVTLGEYVSPGRMLFRLADVSVVKLLVRIPAADIHRLDTGIEAEILVRGINRSFTGKVIHIGPRADDATRSFPVEIFITNTPERTLLPGMFARAIVPLHEYSGAILIPRESVIYKNGEPVVFVVESGGKIASRRRITIARQFGSQYMVSSGLQPGDLLVTSGHRLLVDDATVRIVARRELET